MFAVKNSKYSSEEKQKDDGKSLDFVDMFKSDN